MRKPKHIRDLEQAGKSLAQLDDFRRRLYDQHKITLGWNYSRHTWTFGQVPKSGPTFIAYHVGMFALLEMFGDVDRIAVMFSDRAAA